MGEVIIEKINWRDLIQLLQLIESTGTDNPVSKDCPNGHHNSITCDRGNAIVFVGKLTPKEFEKCLQDGFQWECAICGKKFIRRDYVEWLKISKTIGRTREGGHYNGLIMLPEEDYKVYGVVMLKSLFLFSDY